MALAYRFFEHDDFPALQRLWEESTNWGTLTAEIWRKHVIDAPLGGAGGVVAFDEGTGQLVGQFGFIPSLVFISGRVVRAFRPAAPIVGKSAHSFNVNPLKHPAAAMYLYAVKALRERGDGLIYMVPDPHWMPFFRLLPGLVSGTFPLWSIALPLPARLPLPAGFSVAPLEGWDEGVDRLWDAFSRLHGCAVVRNAEALSWKIGTGEYEIQTVEHEGELVALVASRQKGDRQWLICDLLFTDPGDPLRAALAAACNLADERAALTTPDRPIQKAAVLATPVMEPVVHALGFQRDRYDFPIVIQILDPSIPKQDVAPERWYVSAND